MSEMFFEVWEEPASCCGEHLHWEWNSDELYFIATCCCDNKHFLEPTDAVYSHEETEDKDGY